MSANPRMRGVRNAWYVAAHARELRDEPLSRTILGTGLVLYRTSSGDAVALRDACGHRFAPLSMGTVVGDAIRCPYHGAVFERQGRCIEFPGESEIPKRCSVAGFPVAERYGFVWVWFGAEHAADPALVPELFNRADDPGWMCMDGQFISLKAHYSLVVDNLFDSSHATYVHPTTLGAPGLLAQRGDAAQGTFDADIGERSIDYTVDIANGVGGKIIHDGLGRRMGMESYLQPVDWHLEVSWQLPAYFVFDSYAKPAGAAASESAQFCTFHAITPETETSCNYFYRTVERIDEGKASLCEFWHEGTSVAFNEDKRMLEAQQRALGAHKPFDNDSWGMFKVDDLGMQARRIIKAAEARS